MLAKVAGAAGITPFNRHLIQAGRCQRGILLQGLDDKGQIGINDGATLTAFGFGNARLGDHPFHGGMMQI